ncbi:nuclear transport factor 2 family protein [uncultured Winogradskyella sp.]|uniref:nuclear transport factor 2 family protein n=1 Tax=uncultured Winogradskyella sp. TaxID=395353 RepID=UPI00262AB3C3|nr:nuclear transport factor 2 family protein [uncultured Winogradskyella sp.]
MRIITLFICCLYSSLSLSQSNTEIFLIDLDVNNSKIELSNAKNISNNDGYDNQPSFLDERYIVFASTRNGQTDIAKYDTRYNAKIWTNHTEGGEYSPLKIPNKHEISAVRLDLDGKQRLYTYSLSNGQSTELINNLIVAYYTWFDENTIVSAVIEDKELNLYVSNLLDGTNTKYASNVGRSFHKIPNSNLVSFISKENENQWQIKSLNPKTGVIKVIANTLTGVEDICWLTSKTILSGKDSTLFKLTLNKDNNWKTVSDLTSSGITKITRLSANLSATKLLIAADINSTDTTEESINETVDETNQDINETDTNLTSEIASQIVQNHIKPFNNRQLEEFANSFDADVIVNRFPSEKMYSGRNTLKENYRQFFKNNKKSIVKVINRMTLKNIIIDEELVTLNNRTIRQAVIYKVDSENIDSMTFIRNSNTTSNPETIVNQQLEAYNNKDIDAFTYTYSENIKLYSFPDTLNSDGQEAIKKGYTSFFNSVPDLNAEIVNRIVIGNMVIDKEKVLINGKIYYAIAIYEVENELISKVTFIQ